MKERNITIDYFKLFLCVLVMTIHLQPILSMPSLIGWLISNGFSRIAVPLFFIINGYYLQKHSTLDSSNQTCKYLKRLLVIFLVWSFIYLAGFFNESAVKYIITDFIMGIYHLWYLSALIVAVIFLYYLRKIIKRDIAIFILALILYCIGYYIENYVFDINININGVFYGIKNEAIRVFTYRNALFFGFPFIFFGMMIAKHELKMINVNKIALFLLAFLFLTLLLLESYYLSYLIHIKLNLMLSLIPFCPLIFVIVLKYSQYKLNDGFVGHLSNSIYYVHIFAITIITRLFLIGYNKIFILPLVFFLSLVISAGVIEVNKRIKIFL